MALSWNEIKKRAIEFSKSWEGAEKEKSDAQTFWNEFFDVFGQSRRKVAVLEQEVKKLDESKGWIDLFWPKILIAEAKSRGKDLVKAKDQAVDYLLGIPDEELPQYVLTTDLETMALLDLETGESLTFKVNKLHENIKLFSFIAGYSKTDFKVEDPVNIKAAELMGKLHDSLFNTGFSGHALEVFLVRILFCLFADDTGIFEKDIFLNYIRNKTNIDGTDVGPQLAQLFQLLNTSEDKRYKNLDEDLVKFPYVNGKLYEEVLSMASFDSNMRNSLLECCSFDWGRISPAVFGSLFQSVMDQEKRRNLGAHYTSETNILKVIRPLFLDELQKEFENIKYNKNKLSEFQLKLSKLKFLDPACGCGNFLVVTYRELRLLELEVIKRLSVGQTALDVASLVKLNVDNFYGIEIEEFPAKIAEVAMWLVDHQMNVKLSEELGQYYVRLPLKKSAKIINKNALEFEWGEIANKNELSYILGNPPFIGKKEQSKIQKVEVFKSFSKVKGAGVLDYVCCWYMKACEFIKNSQIQVAFVSTNSITQGEQVSILWKELFDRYNIIINFAHRTFQWNNEARGRAAVHVVIIGFSNIEKSEKYIFDYLTPKSQPVVVKVDRINGYLISSKVNYIERRSNPISNVPKMNYGSIAIDKGNLIISEEEKKSMLNEGVNSKYIRKYVGGNEYINKVNRYCLWLKEANPSEIGRMPSIMDRVKKVEEFRKSSDRKETVDLAEYPTLFGEDRQPIRGSYLLIPKVSSETRKYIPIGMLDSSVIANGSTLIIPNSSTYEFGIITSEMHMVWMKTVAGRMKSDYQYSAAIVYNNFPWPDEVTGPQKRNINEKAQNVLFIRTQFPDATLANLYNPLTMPLRLLKAHKELDLAVDKCYRSKLFKDEKERVEFLFSLYADYQFDSGVKIS